MVLRNAIDRERMGLPRAARLSGTGQRAFQRGDGQKPERFCRTTADKTRNVPRWRVIRTQLLCKCYSVALRSGEFTRVSRHARWAEGARRVAYAYACGVSLPKSRLFWTTCSAIELGRLLFRPIRCLASYQR